MLHLCSDRCLLAARRAAVCCVFLFSRIWRVCRGLPEVQAEGTAGGTNCGGTTKIWPLGRRLTGTFGVKTLRLRVEVLVGFSSQTNAHLLALAVSMVKCKSMPGPMRDRRESRSCVVFQLQLTTAES